MANTDLIEAARIAAKKYGIDPAVVCAVTEQESAWNTYAIRYEPAFRERYVLPLRLSATEEISRSMSWGLMQLMGQVAREHSFHGEFLSELCDPALGLDFGCSVLVSKFSSVGMDVERGLALWNGGANPNYAREVLARIGTYT